MAKKISLKELQRLYEDPSTPKSQLQDYILPVAEQSKPFSPGLIPDPSRVETGIRGSDTEVRAALIGDIVLGWERERRRRQFKEDLLKRPQFKILYMEGDSWCQFPVFIDELYDHLRQSYNIYCTSRAGDTIKEMIFDAPEYPRHLRDMIHLRKYHVQGFIFSGAGNDVVGNGPLGRSALEELLKDFNPNESPAWHIETDRCAEIMKEIAAGYRKLLDTVIQDFPTLAFPDLKVFLHGYDYVQVRSLPNGDPRRPPWATNWTGDPLKARHFPDNTRGSAVIHALIDRLNETTQAVCNEDNYKDRAVYVNLRGSVPADAWADELHAQSRGFHKAAMRFKQALP